MATPSLVYLCIRFLFLSVLILTTTVSSQEYSYMNKDYFLIKQLEPFDQAVTMCKSRGESLVSIKSQGEQDFVWKTIVKPANGYIWLGATNIIGTKTFKWLIDGSDVDSQYSNWFLTYPKQNVNERNTIIMSNGNGIWWDMPVGGNHFIVCERIKLFDSESKLAEHIDKCDANIKQLDSLMKVTASTQRKEYLESITDVKKDYDRVHGQLVSFIQLDGKQYNDSLVQQEVNRKLGSQANDLATELEFQKTQCSQLVSKLNSELNLYRQDNDLLEMRINRIELKLDRNVVGNSNKRGV